jgi:eukaryotic-like serine/threonine-protein kinase
MQARYLLYNRYRIQKSISTGNVPQTYLAIDENSEYAILQGRGYAKDCKLVIKHLRPQSKAPGILETARVFFEKEAKILTDLAQMTDRLPKLYDRFEEEGGFYLVQEFIEGRSLTEELGKNRLSELQTLELLQEILVGLEEIHAQGIIHRDLKPDNIIRRSIDRQLIFIDFGAIKAIQQSTKIQMSKSIGIGSSGYTAKEQWIGKPELASDIYAVGAIGLQCLTGRHPTDLLDDDTSEFQWLHRCQISDHTANILSKMVAKNHLDRYPNAKIARQEIDLLLLDPTIKNPPTLSDHTKIDRSELDAADRSLINATPFIPRAKTLEPTISITEGSANKSPVPIHRRKAIKLLAFFGLGTVCISLLPQVKGLFNLASWRSLFPGEYPKIPSPKLQSLQLKTIKFTSVKLNSKGDIISRPKGTAIIYQEDLGNGVTLSMVKIPAGSFMMGSPDSEKFRVENESPQHQVTLKEFYIGQTEITQRQYQAIMGENPSKFKANNHPVERVDWNQAKEFCRKLSLKTGKNYTLPSESQWEYACRAGTTTPFSFGETITTKVANYEGNYEGKESYRDEPKGVNRALTTDVMSFPPNAFGVYDMQGNVWEWCADTWNDTYEGAPKDGSVWDNRSPNVLLRGGAWSERPELCRSSSRIGNIPEIRVDVFGFRVVCAALPKIS